MTFDPQSIHTTNTIATIAIIIIYLTVLASIAFFFLRSPKKTKE
jgi:hypothetical protein